MPASASRAQSEYKRAATAVRRSGSWPAAKARRGIAWLRISTVPNSGLGVLLWSYQRLSKLVLYSFYKNITLYMTLFWVRLLAPFITPRRR